MERDIHDMEQKKIYGMKKQWENIERVAKLRWTSLEDVKVALIGSLKNNTKDRREIMELVNEPSVIRQVLKIVPDFFSKNYIIVRQKIGERQHNGFFYTTNLHIIKQSSEHDNKIENISYDEKWLLIDKIVPTCNVLLIPEKWLNYSSDAPYPVIIGEKDSDSFQIRYSSSRTAYHKINKYRAPITCNWGEYLTEDQIYSLLHSNNTPFIALTNEKIDWFYHLANDDKTIKKLVQ